MMLISSELGIPIFEILNEDEKGRESCLLHLNLYLDQSNF